MELYRCSRSSSGARKAYNAARFEAASCSVNIRVIRSLDGLFFTVIPESETVPPGYIVSGIVQPNGTVIGA
jgi:hypothetical protein